MRSNVSCPDLYVKSLPTERRVVIHKIRHIFLTFLPPGFEEVMSYGMLGYVVPHTLFPDGYHVNPKLPLPFIGLASQKHYIGLYHSGLYTDSTLSEWFRKMYEKEISVKPNMGKSCVRFYHMEKIPYLLLEELAKKISPQQWINTYQQFRDRKNHPRT